MHPWMRFLTLLALGCVLSAHAESDALAQASDSQADVPPKHASRSAAEQETTEDETDSEKKKPDEPAAAEPTADAKLKKALGSPRATMQTFLDAMNEGRQEDAAVCLDLSELTATEEARKAKQTELAHKLKEVLDKLIEVEVSGYPEEVDVDDSFSLADAQYIEPADREIAERIVISKSEDGLWRFNTATATAIEELYEDLLDRAKVDKLRKVPTEAETNEKPWSIWISEQFPVNMRKTYFLLPGYQWICLAAVVLVGMLADFVSRSILDLLMKVWFRLIHRARAPVVPGMWRPVGLFMQGLTWYLMAQLIGLPLLALTVLLVGLKYFAVIVGIWMSFHLIDLVAKIAARRAAKTPSRFDDLLVPLASKTLKFVTACGGVVICINAFDLQVVGLLGGLGIGGMALAFASQDAISNLFGSVTVLLDRPFEVGDWIVSDDVEGTVEEVGFRSTRVRTFYNSVITIPNSRFTTSSVDNMGRRQFRRFKTTLGVQYDTTPEQLDAFCEGIRELIRRHPYTRKDYYHVYFNDFDDSSLSILLYCFFDCGDWSIELRERHRLLCDILKLASRLNVQFAFPTRTLQMFQGEPPTGDSREDWSDPHGVGVSEAVQIAGPALTGMDRPGAVEFPDPA